MTDGGVQVVFMVRRPRIGVILAGPTEVVGFTKWRDGRVEQLDWRFASAPHRADLRSWLAGPFLLLKRMPSDPIKSQVYDAKTRQPIPGTVVLAVWTNSDAIIGDAGTPGMRLVVRETISDEHGRFWLERPQGFEGAVDERVTVYKIGYTAWNNVFTFPWLWRKTDIGIPERIMLKAFSAARDPQQHRDFVTLVTRATFYGREAAPQFQAAFDHDERP
jgi:hypothetical protein